MYITIISSDKTIWTFNLVYTYLCRVWLQFGTIVHEIGHSLGLWHEQQRADRDDHIKVVEENLGYNVGQFVKQDTVSLGVPYDVGSVMHYDQYVSENIQTKCNL